MGNIDTVHKKPPMLASVSSGKETTTMVTLITEKLQNQSLQDMTCQAYGINLVRDSQSSSDN